MKRKVSAIVALLLILPLWQSFPPPAKAAAQGNAWLPGLYQGWVYFLAKTDFEYNLNEGDVTAQDTSVLFQESHGTVECTVDQNGVGGCTGSFPMDKIVGRSGYFQAKDCNATWTENIRAVGIDNGLPLHPLTSGSIAEGFSVPFNPQSGPAHFDMQVDASGSPTCRSQSASGETTVGIPKWPALDFQVEFHTTYSAGGSCSMATFPRVMDVGRSHVEATIEQCRWMMFFFDPYAKLPGSGG